MSNTNVPLGQFFTVGEQIELREALRARLKDQMDWVVQFEFTTGQRFKHGRESVAQIHAALLKVIAYIDDGEGVGFNDPETLADLSSIVTEVREEAA